jgi:hypothetical protein
MNMRKLILKSMAARGVLALALAQRRTQHDRATPFYTAHFPHGLDIYFKSTLAQRRRDGLCHLLC